MLVRLVPEGSRANRPGGDAAAEYAEWVDPEPPARKVEHPSRATRATEIALELFCAPMYRVPGFFGILLFLRQVRDRDVRPFPGIQHGHGTPDA